MTQNSLSPFNRNLLLFWHPDKKIEFDSWPALLDKVQDQYQINGGKLRLPLYSVLQYWQSIILACMASQKDWDETDGENDLTYAQLKFLVHCHSGQLQQEILYLLTP